MKTFIIALIAFVAGFILGGVGGFKLTMDLGLDAIAKNVQSYLKSSNLNVQQIIDSQKNQIEKIIMEKKEEIIKNIQDEIKAYLKKQIDLLFSSK